LARQFIACLDNPSLFDADSIELMKSIQRLRQSRIAPPPTLAPAIEQLEGTVVGRGDCSVVRLAQSPTGFLAVVKIAKTSQGAALIKREAVIRKSLRHPLVIQSCEFPSRTPIDSSTIITEFAGNGALADHFPWGKGSGASGLKRPNRMAKIIVGIVLAMRYLHSQGIVHNHLEPANILLDWDWNVRIADFGFSTSREMPDLSSVSNLCPWFSWTWVDSRYRAPECYENEWSPRSDVFSFGLLLYELVVGRPCFPSDWKRAVVMKCVTVDGWRPDIPEWIAPCVGKLITKCWADDPDSRLSFVTILKHLESMQFRVFPGVNSAKLAAFVEKVKEQKRSMN
jgi:serine/threonine-protein kinase SIK3